MSLLAADGAFLTQGGAPRTVRGSGGLDAVGVRTAKPSTRSVYSG